jgi:hypothetical protein
VVTSIDQVDCGRPKPAAHRSEQIESGKRIPSALKEQHGKIDPVEMVAAVGARLTRRMERKPQENESLNYGHRSGCGCTRGHAAAQGFTSGNNRQRWGQLPGS